MPNFMSVVLFFLVDFGWWVTILGMVGDHPGDGGQPSMTLFTWSSFGELRLIAKYQVCSTLPSGGEGCKLGENKVNS